MAANQTTSSQDSHRQAYVFDSSVPELQGLIDAVRAGSAGDSAPLFLVLTAGSDGVLELAEALDGVSGLDAIHIFSHGSTGSLYLGSTVLNQASLPWYSQALTQMGSALGDNGDLLVYGCDVGQGSSGHNFIQQLAMATGADVAASTDTTGTTFAGAN